VNRREFITLLGGTAAAWPLAARAQQAGKVPIIGFLSQSTRSASSEWVAAFVQRLRELGWSEGRTIAIEYRWGEGREERFAEVAAEFVRLKVDVILTSGTLAVMAAKRATSVIPIVFATAGDPVANHLVASLARPGGNVTGFMQFEYSLGGKWLELLRELAPGLTRVGVLRDSANAAGIGQWAGIQTAAEPIGVELAPLAIGDAKEIERGIAAFERGGKGGLSVPLSSAATIHRHAIIANAARHRLPAIYTFRYFAAAGGLASYGPDLTGQYRRAAGYVDRILRGEKPSDLPVQRPTKYELALNLKTAKALGLEVPPTLLARADEVIE
jgi:ABC-type uncharacterized transport system substrate-binding protein